MERESEVYNIPVSEAHASSCSTEDKDGEAKTAVAEEISDVVNSIVDNVAGCEVKPSVQSVEDSNSDKKSGTPNDVNNGCKENITEETSKGISQCGFSVESSSSKNSDEPKACNDENAIDVDFRVVDILKTIATYKSLALNKSAHSLLLKEDALIGQLVLFLGDDSENVVSSAFEVVKILYHNRSNHLALKNSLHFLEALIVVSQMSKLPRKIREDARKIYDIVKSAKLPLSHSSNSQNINASQGQAAEVARLEENQSKISYRSGLTSLKGNRSRNNDRETVLSIAPKALHQAVRRQEITTAVVKIKGIISVTYNLNRNNCIIRAKSHVPPEVFGKTIANLGIDCYLVRRNENKEEVLLKMEADRTLENNLSSLEQENLPNYLPDDDDEEDDYLNKNDMLARGDEAATTVTGKITNFLRKSFFW